MKNKKEVTRDEFLDTDHVLSLNLACDVINSEIHWSYKHAKKYHVSKKWLKGYMAGLTQAKQLLITMAKEVYDAG